MMLFVDVGNSRIKWSVCKDDILTPQQSFNYQIHSLSEDLSQAWFSLEIPWQGIYISNVAGQQVAKILTQWVQNCWGMNASFIKSTRTECGIKNGYKKPEDLGIDRWLALIGARDSYAGLLCVVDCGTAVTIDVLSASNQHVGGIIMPSTTTMQKSLTKHAHALHVEAKKQDSLPILATTTQECIQAGTVYPVVAMIEYVMQKAEKQGGKPTLIVTGGGISALLPLFERPYEHVPELVLQGLLALAGQYLS